MCWRGLAMKTANSVTANQSAARHETPAEWMQRLEADVLAGTASPARLAHYLIAQSNGYFASTDAPLDEHIQLTKTGAKT